MVIKEFRELLRDRRTLGMLLFQPIILLLIFGYAANFSVDQVTMRIVGEQAENVATELSDYEAITEKVEIVSVDPQLGAQDVEQLLVDQSADVVVVAETRQEHTQLMNRIEVSVDGSQLFVAQESRAVFARLAAEAAQRTIQEASNDVAQASADASGLLKQERVKYLFNPDLETSWVMIPGLIGLILAFIGMTITSIGLVRERETGTLEQLSVMPLGSTAIIFGKVAPYFLLALVDMIIVTCLGLLLFGVPFVGSLVLFSAVSVVFLLVVLGLGVFISSTSQTTGQAIQLAAFIVIPQTLLSGLVFPLEAMPSVIRWIGYAMPLTWFREMAEGIMLRGAGLETLWVPFIILLGMALAVFSVAVLRMKTLVGGKAVR